jgi:large subunit ribosomal protein L35
LKDGTVGYKQKPNKSVAKRFKVSKTGKLKRHHAYTSHLMSARPSKVRRKLRRSAVLFEGLAKNMRRLMGVEKLRPNKIAHERALAAAAKGEKKKSA